MTKNQRAKILPSLMLTAPPIVTGIGPQLVGLPPSGWLFYLTACYTVALALALAGGRDDDPARSLFHGAPAYWVPCLSWLVASSAAAFAPMIQPHPPGMRWIFLAVGALHSLADLGSRLKNR